MLSSSLTVRRVFAHARKNCRDLYNVTTIGRAWSPSSEHRHRNEKLDDGESLSKSTSSDGSLLGILGGGSAALLVMEVEVVVESISISKRLVLGKIMVAIHGCCTSPIQQEMDPSLQRCKGGQHLDSYILLAEMKVARKFGAVFASITAPIVAALYYLFFAYVGSAIGAAARDLLAAASDAYYKCRPRLLRLTASEDPYSPVPSEED
ncbi:hypothetical protein RJT34_12619 [Clitoria ternatea]|uniref:Uncharacterized protein n=1 Tax=Clitoria ternatea TaxID=43366 RepID=A0AAN9PJH2_CLITE